eukprot:scaffold88161_cov46-Prasinocladus_malaysianus.AAC.1
MDVEVHIGYFGSGVHEPALVEDVDEGNMLPGQSTHGRQKCMEAHVLGVSGILGLHQRSSRVSGRLGRWLRLARWLELVELLLDAGSVTVILTKIPSRVASRLGVRSATGPSARRTCIAAGSDGYHRGGPDARRGCGVPRCGVPRKIQSIVRGVNQVGDAAVDIVKSVTRWATLDGTCQDSRAYCIRWQSRNCCGEYGLCLSEHVYVQFTGTCGQGL